MKEALIDRLAQTHTLDRESFRALLTDLDEAGEKYLYARARQVREEIYGRDVYLRGLIEFTNVCRNDCYYCGIRAGNDKADRYRLSRETILACAQQGYELGFRTIVLQGGEDPAYSCQDICALVRGIKKQHPDMAVTLSIGEKSRAEYQAYFDAGADRYLLRHETADEEHYQKLHPSSMSLANRKRCLRDLKEIGFQTGAGMMVGSPYQTTDNRIDDLYYMQQLQPEMIGIGPFIHHQDTPFRAFPDGSVRDTLHLLAVIRLMFPRVLLPATTALGTMDPQGREKGILAGANVIMPNLSPRNVRDKYLLYDGKISTGPEAAESWRLLADRMESIGYHVVISRGDFQREGTARNAGPGYAGEKRKEK